MSNYPSDKITSRFAKNGSKKVPPSTASQAGSGRASQLEGFKKINSTPLGQGGIPRRVQAVRHSLKDLRR